MVPLHCCTPGDELPQRGGHLPGRPLQPDLRGGREGQPGGLPPHRNSPRQPPRRHVLGREERADRRHRVSGDAFGDLEDVREDADLVPHRSLGQAAEEEADAEPREGCGGRG